MGSGMVGNKHAPVAAMRTSKEVSEPKIAKRRALHLDLLGTVEENRHNPCELSEKLCREIPVSDTKISLALSSEHEFLAKFAEMMGHPLSYQIAHKSSCHVPSDSYAIVEEIVSMLGVPFLRKGEGREVVIPNRAHIAYSRAGVITSSSNQSLVGRDCLDYIACNVHEDLATLVAKEGQLAYNFDSSMFEKTPKDSRTGENMYVGKNFVAFHGAAKTYGTILPDIFGRLMKAFSEQRLDMLTIDLRGGNIYTDGHTEVRRFERDHAVPIPDSAGKGKGGVKGILAFADVVFQPEGETLSPFEGGAYLDVDSPVSFSARYKVKEAGA